MCRRAGGGRRTRVNDALVADLGFRVYGLGFEDSNLLGLKIWDIVSRAWFALCTKLRINRFTQNYCAKSANTHR